jgi:hypothetical protein
MLKTGSNTTDIRQCQLKLLYPMIGGVFAKVLLKERHIIGKTHTTAFE